MPDAASKIPRPRPAATLDAGEIGPAAAALARRARFLEANLAAIPDFVYAFDRQRRFVYANPTMLALFGLSADEMLGKTFADLHYPPDLADFLNDHIDRVFANGETVEDEVFFRSPTGYAAYFAYLWGPARGEDGSVELVVGVSRDVSQRRAFDEALRKSEARLRAATELVGLGIYAWDPVSGRLDWDERLRAMWGLAADAAVDMAVFEAGIHPGDRARVRAAIAACVDPAGDGRYSLEYRVIGRDAVTRWIATAGRATFREGRAVGFIGAAIEVTAQRNAEAAVRASEAQFRSFAAHSSNLIWIGDPAAGTIVYRSAAYERIWGIPCRDAPVTLAQWMNDVHPDDRAQVEHALGAVKTGEVARVEYRIVRPVDGAVRRLRDVSFPIRDDDGRVIRIGGIAEDLTQNDLAQVYIVGASAGDARRLGSVVRGLAHRVRTFDGHAEFLDIAAVLAAGCVLLDLRRRRKDGLAALRELKARSIPLPVVALDRPEAGAAAAVAAMKAGAVDYLIARDDAAFAAALARAIAECASAARPTTRDESASARVAKLTPRERDVLVGLVDGETNKMIGQRLGISPRTVELHRSQVMHRLNAGSLTELLQVALAAGITPSADGPKSSRKSA